MKKGKQILYNTEARKKIKDGIIKACDIMSISISISLLSQCLTRKSILFALEEERVVLGSGDALSLPFGAFR